MMIITEVLHSQRHIPSADGANPVHGSGVYALITKVYMTERIRIRPFIERQLICWCLVKMHMIFGLPNARHRIFVNRSRELQAIELECEIQHDPEE